MHLSPILPTAKNLILLIEGKLGYIRVFLIYSVWGKSTEAEIWVPDVRDLHYYITESWMGVVK